MTQTITRLNPSSLPDASQAGYSQISVVEGGRTAYISGQVAWTADGKPVPEDIADQAVIVAENVKAALSEINAKPENIIMARIYMTDLTEERMGAALPPLFAAFDGTLPSLTGVGVAALAAPDLQLEMELIVNLPDK